MTARATDGARAEMEKRYLFIGGYPKGYDEAFSPLTTSGRNLRKIVAKLGLDAHYLDIWETRKQERIGWVPYAVRASIRIALRNGEIIVPLGHYQNDQLNKIGFKFPYFTHPARHPQRLEEQLRNIV